MTVMAMVLPQRAVLASAQDGACRADAVAPIQPSTVLQHFDGPAKPWLSGHRGIDLAASDQAAIVAPTAGVISFAGTVAHKQVVSLKTKYGTMTFEPAVTAYQVGHSLTRGSTLGHVEGHSDHCDHHCLHWGIKLDQRQYRDPETLLEKQQVRLKPWE
ncbi:peptidoglycan DD-metalloendopeptidase family protein [Bifidobacterium dolichotidis]|nr:peptidoglycan DD-metalloendopeptidase family protein [Bifidobacterium dolichotidis]